MVDQQIYQVLALRYATQTTRTRQDNFLAAVADPDVAMPMDYFIWVIRNAAHTIIVDTGFGHADATRRERPIMRLPCQALAAIGIDAATVADVVITHLHFDHAGTLGDFPRARFHIQQTEVQFVVGP